MILKDRAINKNHQRAIVINIFGIGDSLFTTPLVRILKKRMPDLSIDFMCNKRTQHLFKNNQAIDDIIIFEKDDFREAFRRSKKEFIKKVFAFIRAIKEKRYVLAVDLSLGYHISMLLKFLGVRRRVGFNYRGRGRFLTDKLDIAGFHDKHVVDYYLDVLKLIDIGDFNEKELELRLPQEIGRWADDFLRQHNLSDRTLIGIAPGGGKSWGGHARYRRWDAENFARVGIELIKKDPRLFFLIFGSGEEDFLGERVTDALKDRALGLCGRLSLLESAALMKRCGLILCNEGGILHMAVSQKVKTISVFGPVDDKVYGPYPLTDDHKVVVAEDVKCRPCYRNFKLNACQTHLCLADIDINKVIKLAEEVLGI